MIFSKKSAAIVLSLLFAFFSYARAEEPTEELDPNGPWMICNISVDGLKNIRKKTVTKAAHAKKGELYERMNVSEDVQDISALGSFDSVEIDITPMEGTRKEKETGIPYNCHRLTYLVKEKPIFDRITYQGRKHLGKGAITQAMTLKIKDPFNEVKLQSDLPRIMAKYAEKGYVNAQVSYELETNEQLGVVYVKLIIDEGERVRVAALNLDTNGLQTELPLEKIIKKASNRPHKVFKPQNLQKDWVKMMLYGRNKGYSEFNLSQPKITYNDDKTETTLTYALTEGPQVDFGDVSFEGNSVFTQQELDKQIFFRSGQRYNQKDFDDTISAIQEQYADQHQRRQHIP